MKITIKLTLAALLTMIIGIGFGTATTHAAAVGKQTNLSGLVGWWTFDEGAGSVAHDFSGTGNNGTIGAPAWSAGKLGKALDMSSGSSVTVPSSSSLQLGTNSFTIAMWGYMRIGGSPYSTFMISKYNDTACYAGAGGTYTPGGWEIGHGYNATGMNICYSDGVNATVNGSVGFDSGYQPAQWINKWTHLVVVIDKSAGRIRFYVNGVKQTNEYDISSVTGSVNANRPLVLGQLHGWQTDGKFDELRIYNRALAVGEITALYKSGEATRKAANNTGLVGWWKMDEATSTIAHDFSGNRFNATLTNGAAWTRGKKGMAATLDGTNDYIATGAISTGIPTNGPATISGWFYPTTTAMARGSGIYYFRDLYQHSLNNYLYLLNGADYFNVTSVLTPNRWHHIAYTYNGTHENTILYLNGVQYSVNIQTASQNHAALSPFYIGSDNGGTGNFPGMIDDVRIYNRVLTLAEVKELYAENSTIVGTTQSSVLTNGLVGYWSFNGKDIDWAARKAWDRSNGQLNNGTLTNLSQATSTVAGKFGQALGFSGGEFVDTGTSNSLNVNTAMTLSAWVKPTGSGHRVILARGRGGVHWDGYELGISSGFARVTSQDAAGVGASTFDMMAGLVTNNVWTHVGFSYDGTTGRMYINGVLAGSTTGTFASTSGYPNYIGKREGGSNFTGSIDEVRIYNRALSASEMKQLYLQGK